jgi:hypothetical protein
LKTIQLHQKKKKNTNHWPKKWQQKYY